MPSLRELQTDFVSNLFETGADVTGSIEAGAFSGAERLQVYRNNVFISLTAALGSVYPVVERLVGEGFFKYACHEYIKRYPSRSGNLHDFGAAMPEFLAEFEPAAELSYLSDAARLEWAMHEVFHAAGHAPISLEKLAEVPPERYADLRFTTRPASRLIASQYPVLRIWEVNQEDFDGDQSVDLDAGDDWLLVTRPDLEVEFQRLSAPEYAFLAALSESRTFGEACEAALGEQADFDIGACLQKHVGRQTLVDFEY